MKCFHRLLLLCCCLPCVAVIAAESAVPLPEAKLTIKVVDEDNQPLPEMPVHVWLSESAIRDGQSDSNGVFVAEGTCTIKDIPISIVKQGYYDSRLTYSYPNYVSVKYHKWQPWNPVVTAMVRRVVNPIPMYAKKVETIIPLLDQFIGYDLMSGDWIAPYGAGKVADLNFRIRKRVAAFLDFDGSLDLAVTNVVDGLQESSLSLFMPSGFRLLRQAPSEDYVVTKLQWFNSSTNFIKYNADQSYYVRIRSETNESGQVISAMYGKIRSYIGFGVRGNNTGTIQFTYYLNPTPNDRNLEFDPKRNLFKDLKSTEQVREP